MKFILLTLLLFSSFSDCEQDKPKSSVLIGSETIFGNWLITDFRMREISGYSKEEADNLVAKFIQISSDEIVFTDSPPVACDSFTKEKVEVDFDWLELFGFEDRTMTEYVFYTSLGYTESIYLISKEIIIYEADGVIFKCEKMK